MRIHRPNNSEEIHKLWKNNNNSLFKEIINKEEKTKVLINMLEEWLSLNPSQIWLQQGDHLNQICTRKSDTIQIKIY